MIKQEATISHKVVFVTVSVLLLFTVLAIYARLSMQQADEFPGGDTAWEISVTHQIEALEKGAMIAIAPPWDTLYSRLYAQSLSHTGLRQKRTKTEGEKRDVELVSPAAGSYSAVAVFSVHVSSLKRSEPKKLTLSEQNRSQWLADSPGVSINTPVANRVIETLLQQITHSDELADELPDKLIEKIYGYVSSNIRIDKRASSESEKALTVRRATSLGANRVLLALLRTAHLPARLVTGVNLQAAVERQPFYWVEVYQDETWLPLDPVYGYLKQLPAFYIPLRKGDQPLVVLENALLKSTVWHINTTHIPKDLLSSDSNRLTDILNLNRLSPLNRENLGVLLLLPLGVLASEILRQFAGIRTYGTFTPTLIALAVVHVDWITALITFLFVAIIGITIRAYLSNFHLQRTASLSIVFTLVAISMALVISGFMYFDPRSDSFAILLPVVILTMLVDRIYTIADQRGTRTAMIRLIWTVVSAMLSLIILLQADWSIWLVAYPELHAVTLACIIAMGVYRGPKLSGIPGLSWFQEPAIIRVRGTVRKKTTHSETSEDGM